MSVAVVSSVYGGYDTPLPPLTGTAADEWVMVTDQPHVEGWRTVHEPRHHVHPRLAAKVAKCRPDLYTDADVSIWLDASIVVLDPDFVAWCVDQLGDGLIAQIVHPERQRITDEADVSEKMQKYQGQPVKQQAAHYIRQGFPDGWGLWATGVIVRRRHPVHGYLGDEWLREQMRWSWQDQLSQAPLLYGDDIRPEPLNTPLWRSNWFTIRPHASNS